MELLTNLQTRRRLLAHESALKICAPEPNLRSPRRPLTNGSALKICHPEPRRRRGISQVLLVAGLAHHVHQTLARSLAALRRLGMTTRVGHALIVLSFLSLALAPLQAAPPSPNEQSPMIGPAPKATMLNCRNSIAVSTKIVA